MFLVGRSENIRGRLFQLRAGTQLIGIMPGKGPGVFLDQDEGEEYAEVIIATPKVILQKFSPRVKLFVNGRKVTEAELQDEDEILIEDLIFKFAAREESLLLSQPGQIEISDQEPASTTALEAYQAGERTTELTDNSRLGNLLSLTQELSRSHSSAQLNEMLITFLSEQFQTKRACILTWNDVREQFELAKNWPPIVNPDAERIQISRTLLNLVLHERKAILSQDITIDERFQESESLQGQFIRSILCAPMVLDDKVLGVLYLDTPTPSPAFNEENLQLLTMAANLAASTLHGLHSREVLDRENKWLKQTKNVFIGKGRAIQGVLKLVERAAPTDVTVLLRGETGTGKELIARMIHDKSPRRHAPFESVNCAALSETLLESELFGHEKGAFTGAKELKKGKFEIPDGGTLFLDEIGEIHPNIQVKLLRFLQERTFERVGGTKSIQVNLRIIAATNKNLEEAMKAGEFREDLYYRLNVVQLDIPPLRARLDEIPLLSEHFISRFAVEINRQPPALNDETFKIMKSYHWPGNVRQLKNTIERMVVLSPSDTLYPEDLPWDIQPQVVDPANTNEMLIPYKNAQEHFEREYLHRLMLETHGNVTRASQKSEIERTHLHSKLKKYGISPGKYRV